VAGDRPQEELDVIGAALRESLEGAGLELEAGDSAGAVLTAQANVATGPDGEWVSVEWAMLTERDAREGADSSGTIRGHWILVEPGMASSGWWQRVGIAMSLDAIRAWAMPRPASVEFPDATSGQLLAIRNAAMPYAFSGESSEDLASIQIVMAGDPLAGIQTILEDARLADGAGVEADSMTRLVCTFGNLVLEGKGESAVAGEGDPLSIMEAKVAAIARAKADLLSSLRGVRVGDSMLGDLMSRRESLARVAVGLVERATVRAGEDGTGKQSTMRATATLVLTPGELDRLAALP
jgi:hypothetical protein